MARSDARYQLWVVKSLREGQKNFLKGLDTKGAISIWKECRSNMDLVIEGQRTTHVQKLLRDRDILYEIINPDFNYMVAKGKIINNLAKPLRFFTDKKFRSVLNWKDFYPLNVIYNFMHSLEVEFPSTCTVCTIGKTDEGRDLKMLRISNSDAANYGVWMDGAVHAREWISTSVVTYLANYIAKNFSSLPEYMTNKDWYFLPVVNPDGYAYTHVHDRLWRKNRATYDGHVTGVDLNRNFSINWGRLFEGSSNDPNHINFRGSEPFSEPESYAIKEVIMSSNTIFKVFISFHSFSEVITFPWCHVSEPCPDYVRLLEGGTAMAKAISETNGHMYKVGSFKDLMYAASGTSIDWSYGAAKIPYSYLIELRSKQHRFVLPTNEILDTCKEILNGTKALMKYVDKERSGNKSSNECKIVDRRRPFSK